MKKISLIGVLFFSILSTFAQDINVKGKIIDENGIALPGVSVMVKNSTKGTSADFDGNYQINTPKGSVLIFSFIGFKPKELTVTSSNINVTLIEDANVLDEVVVTAYGIKKKEKALGYSLTNVKAEDLNLSGQNNPVAALQGQVAGLRINQNSGTPGGGVDILIRGISSMNPGQNNQPLIVIDGVSINNDTFTGDILPSEGSNAAGSSEQFAFSSRMGDINPEDIETFNILKGAAATALYGIRAANGAIIITTKKGKLGKPKFNISSSTTFNKVVKTPAVQNIYREGFYDRPEVLYTPNTPTGFTSVFNSTPFQTWGVPYTQNEYIQKDGTVVDLSNDRFYDKYELFNTGINTNMNFNVSGASEKIDYYFSIGNASSKGVIPKTDFSKTSIRFKAGYKTSDKFSINSSVQYTNSGARKPTGGDKSIMSALAYFSPTFPVNDYINPDGSQRNYSAWIDNPRYNVEVSAFTEKTQRWIGNINLNYQPAEWLNINYTAQVDNFTENSNRFVPPELDTGSTVKGFVIDQVYGFTGLESNLLATFTKELSSKFNSSFIIGNSILDNHRTYHKLAGEGLNIPYFNHISNTAIRTNRQYETRIRNIGVFGELKLDYDDKLFLSVTGRNDWDSTLYGAITDNYFYSSVSLAYDFTKDLLPDSSFMNFGKIRASYAEVGNGTSFGKIGYYFVPDGDFPWEGVGGYRADTSINHPDLKPERRTGWEVGTDLRFFQNRLRIDYAYFTDEVRDAIFSVDMPPSTGVKTFERNAGIYQTKGNELLVEGTIIKNDNFSWKATYNFWNSTGTVKELPDEVPALTFYNSTGIDLAPREGDNIGQLYGWDWVRTDDGKVIIESDGLPRRNENEKIKVGNVLPDFTMSLGNNFKWKQFELNFLLEWKKGGDKMSWTRYVMNRMGTSEHTLSLNRGGTYVFEGVMDDGTGNYVPNTQEANFATDSPTMYRYFNWGSRGRYVAENNLQDASWLKLRNIGLTYNLNNQAITKIGINNVALSASVNNILLWTPYDGYDPEGSDFSSGSNIYGFSGRSVPLTENYSLAVSIGF